MTGGPAGTADPATRWWQVPRAERGVAAAGLLVALFLGATPTFLPWHDLDATWQVGISAARSIGLQFGSDLVFTYGPWGFVDHPYTVDHLQFTVGVLIAIAVVTVLWLATYAGLRRLMSVRPAVLTATLVVILCGGAAEISALAVTAAGMVVVLELLTPGDESDHRLPIGLVAPAIGACAGLFMQVKLSTGVAMLVVALLAACAQRSWLRALLTLAATVVSTAISFLVLWVVIGQDLGDLPDWVRGSREAISGYSEAMGVEPTDYLLGYLAGLGLGVFILVTSLRGIRPLGRAGGAVLVLLCLALLDVMLKAAFTRHAADHHERAFFVLTTGLLIAIAPLARHRTATLVAVAVSLVMIFPGLQAFDVGQARDRWRTTLQAAVVPGAAATYTATSKEEGRAAIQLPQTFVDLIGQHPVAVDPVEAALPIDYDMQWHPMPVPQTYAAYTAYLDDLNAEAARSAPADQHVLRYESLAIDGRNPQWETPAYLLALGCDYRALHREGRWTLLEHAQPTCGDPEEVSTQEVSAGQQVDVPKAGDDEIVVARFDPEPSSLLSRAFSAAFKDFTPFEVTVDGQTYRMPEQLAGQPAMMAYPDEGDDGPIWPFSYATLAYDRPGTVTFETISTDGSRG